MAGDPDLFSQYRMGDLTLPNRIVMAPMTRSRAGDADVPVSLTVTYYVQRASAGMIITEGSQVSPQGVGYMHTPGIYSAAQVAGWKKVTDASPQGWRQDFHPALARRAGFPLRLPGWRSSCRTIRATRRRLCPYTRWKKANSSAQGPGDRRGTGHRQAVSAGGGERQNRRLRWCRNPWC